MEGAVFEKIVRVNGTCKYVKIFSKPRPTLLLWSSEELYEEFPFQPQAVLELGRAEIEAASTVVVVLGNVFRRDPTKKGEAPQKRTLTFSFETNGELEQGKLHPVSPRYAGEVAAVELYKILCEIGVNSLVPVLVSSHSPSSDIQLLTSETLGGIQGAPSSFTAIPPISPGDADADLSKPSPTLSSKPTPSAKAIELGRGFSRVKTLSDLVDNSDERKPLSDCYTLCELLGEGGFANVYRAIHNETGRDVAVKMMLLESTEPLEECAESLELEATGESEEGSTKTGTVVRKETQHSKRVREFEWEIRIMKRIRDELPFHVNLVRLLSVCTENDPPRTCLVMEKLDGGELFDRIVERSHYTEKDAGFLFRTLVRAIHSLHQIRILHRDIKPENILFSDTGFYSNVKICDFGTACFMDLQEEDPYEGKKIGSQGYTAPEVIQTCTYTPACDVWSLGVLLYCLLVGYLPFPEGFMQTLKIITGKFEFHDDDWSDISDDAKDLLRKMLTSRRTQRITTADILEHPWVVNVDLDKDQSEPDLKTTQNRMKTFSLRRKFKASAMAAVWSAKIRLNRVLKEKTLESIRGGFGLRNSARSSQSTQASSISSLSSNNQGGSTNEE